MTLPTLAQVLGVTHRDWPLSQIVDTFAWLRPGLIVPRLDEHLPLDEAFCIWSRDLCVSIQGKNTRIWEHIQDDVQRMVPELCTDPAGLQQTQHLLLIADDRWVFCTGQIQAYDIQQGDLVALTAVRGTIKSLAYNLSQLALRNLVECELRDPRDGHLLETPRADSQPSSPTAT